MLVGNDLARAPPGREEAEAGAIARPDATLQKSAELPGIGRHDSLGRRVVWGGFGLCRCIQCQCPKSGAKEAKSFHPHASLVFSAKERPPAAAAPLNR